MINEGFICLFRRKTNGGNTSFSLLVERARRVGHTECICSQQEPINGLDIVINLNQVTLQDVVSNDISKDLDYSDLRVHG